MNHQKVEPASLWYHDNLERVEAEGLLSDAGMIPEMFIVRTIKMFGFDYFNCFDKLHL